MKRVKKFRGPDFSINPRVDCVSYMKSGNFKSRRQRDWIDNTYDGHPTTLSELFYDDRALPDVILDYKEKLEFLIQTLEKMEEQAAFLLIRRFGLGGALPQSLEEIGSDIGWSDTKVHFGLTRAIEELNRVTGLNLLAKALQKAALGRGKVHQRKNL